jgi:hypothetical protein
LKCHSTQKLSPSTSWTTFIKVDFEVFRWNLENAGKVPEGTHQRQVLSGVWPCLWPRLTTGVCWLGQGVNRGCRLGFRGDGPGWPRFDHCRPVWLGWFGH